MLGCIHPMSSPMMKRMLGFCPCGCCCCWAEAGMLAIVVAVHITTRAPQIDLNRLMVAFLSVGLVSAAEAWAAAFARLRRLTGFGCPRGMWFRANGRTPSGAEIRRSALGALCTFGIFYVCGTRCRVTATDQRWRGTSPGSRSANRRRRDAGPWFSVGSWKIIQRLDRQRNHVRRPPWRWDLYYAGRPNDAALGEHVTDDRRDAAGTIDHWRSGGAVIDHKAVVAFINLQERRAGDLAIISKSNEPSSHKMRAPARIGECHDLFFRHERLLADRNGPRTCNRALEFDHGQFFA